MKPGYYWVKLNGFEKKMVGRWTGERWLILGLDCYMAPMRKLDGVFVGPVEGDEE